MKTKIFILALSLCLSSAAFALVAGPSKIIGKVKSYDTMVVTIDNDKATYKVPRQFVTVKSLKAGAKIEVLLNNEQLSKIKVSKKIQKKK